jgi:2-dehydropantoate 2-reductase
MEYVIVGAGSLGQSFAALLAVAGERVTLLTRPGGEARLRAAGAISLTGAANAQATVGPDGVTLTSDVSSVPEGAAVIFTTKGQDLPEAVDAVRLGADRSVAWAAGVQNGLAKDDVLAAAFGVDRVVGSATIFSAQRQADGSVRVATTGSTYFGELDGRVSDRVQEATKAFNAAGIPTFARDDIQSVLWSKGCNATGVFGVAVLARVSNQQLVSNPHLMRAYLALVRETAAIGLAYGVEVGDYEGFPPIRTYVDRSDQATLDLVQPLSGSASQSYASMTHDVLAGLPLEVDAVFGDIVERADRKGVPAPCLRLVRDLIRGIDAARPIRAGRDSTG